MHYALGFKDSSSLGVVAGNIKPRTKLSILSTLYFFFFFYAFVLFIDTKIKPLFLPFCFKWNDTVSASKPPLLSVLSGTAPFS